MKDDQNMISKLYSSYISNAATNPAVLEAHVMRFKQLELNCIEDIDSVIENASKAILQLMQANNLEPEITIEQIINLASSYSEIQSIIRAVLGSGLLWGTARFDEEFEHYFGVSQKVFPEDDSAHYKPPGLDFGEIF